MNAHSLCQSNYKGDQFAFACSTIDSIGQKGGKKAWITEPAFQQLSPVCRIVQDVREGGKGAPDNSLIDVIGTHTLTIQEGLKAFYTYLLIYADLLREVTF